MHQILAVSDSIESPLTLSATQTAQTFRELERQRGNLLRALVLAQQQRKISAPGSPERVAAQARLTVLNQELRNIRDQTRGAKEARRLDRFLIEVIREQIDPAGWAQLVQQARERRAALDLMRVSSKPLHAP